MVGNISHLPHSHLYEWIRWWFLHSEWQTKLCVQSDVALRHTQSFGSSHYWTMEAMAAQSLQTHLTPLFNFYRTTTAQYCPLDTNNRNLRNVCTNPARQKTEKKEEWIAGCPPFQNKIVDLMALILFIVLVKQRQTTEKVEKLIDFYNNQRWNNRQCQTCN